MTNAEPPTGRDLTPMQRRILRFMEDYTQRTGHSPSYREIAGAVGLKSLSSVFHHRQALQHRGYLNHTPGRPRTAVVNADAGQVASVPLVGRIAAGGPVLAEWLIEDMVPVPAQWLGTGMHFLLRVAGDSMTGACIADGDLVLVRQQPDAENGEIVAAQIPGIEEEGTVKTLRRSGRQVWLMPQNPAYTPIPGDNATIAGKVVRVLRQL